MTIKTILRSSKNGEPLYTAKPFNGKEILITANYHNVHGSWRDVATTSATTTIVAEPDSEGYLVLTYLEVSAEKNNSGVVTIQVTDGVNTEIIFERKLATQPLVAEIDFSGSRIAGWKNARLEMVTSGASFDANALVAYTKLPDGPDFSEWDANR